MIQFYSTLEIRMAIVATAALFVLVACGGQQSTDSGASTNAGPVSGPELGPEGLPIPELVGDLVDPRVSVAVQSCTTARAVIVTSTGHVDVFSELVAGWSQITDGDLFYVCPGVHAIHSTLYLSRRIGVVVAGHDATIASTVDDTVVHVEDSENLVIDGLRIVHDIGEYCLHNCLQIIDSVDVTVSHNQLDGSGYTGLVMIGSQELRIIDNQIHNCEFATSSYNVWDIEVRGNHVFGNRAQNFDSNLIDVIGEDLLRATNRIESVTPPADGHEANY